MDLIVSNPPYIAEADAPTLQKEVLDWEPHSALFGGCMGADVYRRLFEQALSVLRPGGRLIVELGYSSLESVRGFLGDDWCEIEVVEDLAGWPRVFAAERVVAG